jgi:hypothetical protein
MMTQGRHEHVERYGTFHERVLIYEKTLHVLCQVFLRCDRSPKMSDVVHAVQDR